MRSRTPLPARGQGQVRPFLEAAVLFAALCIFARSAALVLAAAITAPLPMAETLLWLGRQAAGETASSVQEQAEPESVPQGPASSLPQAVQALPGSIEDYLVPLLGEDARPADAGKIIEKQYPQGSGEKYIPCGAGSIKNNTRQSAADIAAEIQNPLPFAIEPDSPDPQVLVMHTHATEDYRLSAGLWFAPGDGARSTDRSINMCAVGRVMADTLNAAGICTLHDETLNDYPSYTGSYANSRAVVQQYLAQYPSIKVVLDVHRDALVGNLGLIAPVREAGMRVHGDFGLNIFNSASMNVMRSLEMASATVSFEMTLPQIRDMSKAVNAELIAYGRLPLMVTEHCLIHNKTNECTCHLKATRLIDKTGAEFPVIRDGDSCRSVLLNGKKLSWLDRQDDLAKLGLWATRLYFTTENSKEVDRVLNDYMNPEPLDPGACTRGLYLRGVE